MNTPRTIFSEESYTITGNIPTGGTYLVNSSASVGETVTITNITPSATYQLKAVKILKTSDNSDITTTVGYNSTNKTFTMPAYDVKVSVEFELIPYKITTLTRNHGAFTVPDNAVSGQTITIDDTPSLGYEIDSVVIKNTSTGTDITELVGYDTSTKTFTMPNYPITVRVTFKLSPVSKTITIREMENGTVTSDKSTVAPGETVTLTVTPSEGYKLKEIKLLDMYDEMPVTLNEDNTFTMPSYNVFISAEFELIYIEKTITKTEDDMTASVKGTFSGEPVLVITKIESGNEGYNSLIELVKEDKEVIGLYDVSITGGTYEGDKITIYHKKASGDVETLTATVKDGKVVITVSELSPFMLVADKEVVEQKDITPKTGDNIMIYITLIIIATLGLGIVLLKNRNNIKNSKY